MESITLSTKGQIIIPARIRKKYGMKKGEKLLITDENNYIKIIPKTRLADLRYNSSSPFISTVVGI